MSFSEINQLDVPLMQIYVTVIILWFCVFLCVITYDTKKSRKYIFFDGIIGAGKTTLIKLLEENMKKSGYKTKAIYEPVDEWEKSGALKLFYQDIVKHCYEFQTYTFITRVERLLNEIYEEEDIEYYLIERSIFTDKYIFVEMLKDTMGPIRMTMYNKWNTKVPTAKLNKWLNFTQQKNPPPLKSGRVIKIKYCTQVNIRPPTFVFFTNLLGDFEESYKRYLLNNLRDEFDLNGVPLRLMFKNSKNPYI